MQHQTGEREDHILFRGSNRDEGRRGPERNGSPRQCGTTAPAEFVRSIIRARAMRREFFGETLFSDPAWDILLELYALGIEGVRISVSKLSVAAGVPQTTALRWIDKLESDGLVARADDRFDGRRIWVEISDLGCRTMNAYLEQVESPALAI